MTLELTEEEKKIEYRQEEEQYERYLDDLYDGMDEWINNNKQELMEDYILDLPDDFRLYCQTRWNEFKED